MLWLPVSLANSFLLNKEIGTKQASVINAKILSAPFKDVFKTEKGNVSPKPQSVSQMTENLGVMSWASWEPFTVKNGFGQTEKYFLAKCWWNVFENELHVLWTEIVNVRAYVLERSYWSLLELWFLPMQGHTPNFNKPFARDCFRKGYWIWMKVLISNNPFCSRMPWSFHHPFSSVQLHKSLIKGRLFLNSVAPGSNLQLHLVWLRLQGLELQPPSLRSPQVHSNFHLRAPFRYVNSASEKAAKPITWIPWQRSHKIFPRHALVWLMSLVPELPGNLNSRSVLDR